MKNIFIILFFSLFAYSSAANNDSLKALLKTGINDTTKLNVLKELANNYQSLGQLNEAAFYHRQMFDLATRTNNIKGLANYYNYEGRAFFYKQAFDSAISCFKKSLDYFEKIDYVKGVISSRNNIAVIYKEKGDIKKALAEQHALVTICKRTKDDLNLATAYANIGTCFMAIFVMDSAIAYTTKSSRLHEQLKLTESLASDYYNLASINFSVKQQDKAIFYLKEIFEKKLPLKKNLRTLIYILNAHIYTDLNQVDLADYYADKAIADCRLNEDKSSLISSLLIKVDILKLKKDQQGQKKYILEAIDISKEIESTIVLARAYSMYGDFLLADKNYNEAIKLYKQSNALFSENSNSSDIIYNIKGLAEVNSRMGNFKESAMYLDSLIKYKDHLNEQAVLETLKDIEAKYETEKKDLLIQNARSQISLEEGKNRQKTIVIWIGSFALLITVFFGIVAFINFKRTQKANKIVEAQKRTIEEKQKEVIDSIRYAKRIQESLMPTEKYIERVLEKFRK